MFLQFAIDAPSSHDALTMLDRVKDVKEIDYIEIGAPLVTHYGVPLFHTFAASVSPERIYVDLKTIDFPAMEYEPWLKAGARRVSAMAVMNDEAFSDLNVLLGMDRNWDLEVFISMMGYPLDHVTARVRRLSDFGFDNFIAHGAGSTTKSAFKQTLLYCHQIRNSRRDLKLVAAGGITVDNCGELIDYEPDGIIMGRGLTQSDNPGQVASAVKQLVWGDL